MSVCTQCGSDNHAMYTYCLKCAAELPPDPLREPIYVAPVARAVEREPAPEPTEPDLPEDLSGMLVERRYQLGEVIGRDATSVFYSATHTEIAGARLVVRVLTTEAARAPGSRDRMFAEAQRLVKVRSFDGARGHFDISVADVMVIGRRPPRAGMLLLSSEGVTFGDLLAFIESGPVSPSRE